MKKQIEFMLIALYMRIGIDQPANHEYIVEFVINNVIETRIEGDDSFTSEDVNIAFRRFLESINNGEY